MQEFERTSEEEAKSGSDRLSLVKELIELGSLDKAQAILNRIDTESGRKYYLQSLIYKERKWYNEQRKQLKNAVKLEPDRKDYKKELAELEEFAKTKEYKSAVRKHRMDNMGNDCADGCALGCGSIDCCAGC